MNRRELLASTGIILSATTAGCLSFLNGQSTMFPDGETLEASPGDLLIDPDKLPEEDRNPWVETDRESSDSRARQVLQVKNAPDVQSFAGSWRYLVIRVEIFDTIKEAKSEYEETEFVFENSAGFLESSGSELGDEGLFYAPDADDTHLIFRENNIFVDIVELEGNKNVKKIVKKASKFCASRFSESVTTE